MHAREFARVDYAGPFMGHRFWITAHVFSKLVKMPDKINLGENYNRLCSSLHFAL